VRHVVHISSNIYLFMTTVITVVINTAAFNTCSEWSVTTATRFTDFLLLLFIIYYHFIAAAAVALIMKTVHLLRRRMHSIHHY